MPTRWFRLRQSWNHRRTKWVSKRTNWRLYESCLRCTWNSLKIIKNPITTLQMRRDRSMIRRDNQTRKKYTLTLRKISKKIPKWSSIIWCIHSQQKLIHKASNTLFINPLSSASILRLNPLKKLKSELTEKLNRFPALNDFIDYDISYL